MSRPTRRGELVKAYSVLFRRAGLQQVETLRRNDQAEIAHLLDKANKKLDVFTTSAPHHKLVTRVIDQIQHRDAGTITMADLDAAFAQMGDEDFKTWPRPTPGAWQRSGRGV
jgi:hypothetical protein